jgi:hypothetical protein
MELAMSSTTPFDSLIGTNFTRVPADSTSRYASWLNGLTHDQLLSHRLRDLTIIQPTWLMPRAVFDRVGGYVEDGRGVPEDLIFFYKHIEMGGAICKVDQPLLIYRYHTTSACFAVKRLTLV